MHLGVSLSVENYHRKNETDINSILPACSIINLIKLTLVHDNCISRDPCSQTRIIVQLRVYIYMYIYIYICVYKKTSKEQARHKKIHYKM